MFDIGGAPHSTKLTLYTDAFVISGTLETRQRRLTDLLNQDDVETLVLTDVTFDEFGPAGQTIKAPFAQVNLTSVLFVVTQETVEAAPELRTNKQQERAIVSVPPFKVIGNIHVMAERSLREALTELTGHFVPVTDATYWSDTLGEARATASLVAVNHRLAQIMAPHKEVDPWAGISMAPPTTATPDEPDGTPPPPGTEPTGWE
jgi:hypothetical protein